MLSLSFWSTCARLLSCSSLIFSKISGTYTSVETSHPLSEWPMSTAEGMWKRHFHKTLAVPPHELHRLLRSFLKEEAVKFMWSFWTEYLTFKYTMRNHFKTLSPLDFMLAGSKKQQDNICNYQRSHSVRVYTHLCLLWLNSGSSWKCLKRQTVVSLK